MPRVPRGSCRPTSGGSPRHPNPCAHANVTVARNKGIRPAGSRVRHENTRNTDFGVRVTCARRQAERPDETTDPHFDCRCCRARRTSCTCTAGLGWCGDQHRSGGCDYASAPSQSRRGHVSAGCLARRARRHGRHRSRRRRDGCRRRSAPDFAGRTWLRRGGALGGSQVHIRTCAEKRLC